MDWQSELAKNIISLMKKSGITGAKPFAKKCKVSDTLIRHVLAGTGNPGIAKLETIANTFNVPLSDVLPLGSRVALNKMPPDDYCKIKLYDVQGSAGPGAYVENEIVVDILSFREKWIRNELNCDPSQLTMIFVTGDSMEPTLHSGDVVLVDHSAANRVTDAIWVIGVEEGPLIKRVQVLPGAKARIISDNKTYEKWDVDLKDLPEGMRFIGRVVWSGRRM